MVHNSTVIPCFIDSDSLKGTDYLVEFPPIGDCLMASHDLIVFMEFGKKTMDMKRPPHLIIWREHDVTGGGQGEVHHLAQVFCQVPPL